jgi:geranylgeranylglycerol-phosphate geranylgeranyltransferase
MGKFLASWQLIRPVNAFMGGIGVIVGALSSGFLIAPNWITLVLGYFVVFSVSATGMIINDITDIEVDRINCPERVLPSGRLTINDARILFSIYLIAGFILSILTLNVIVVLITVLGSCLTIAYSIKLKKLGFIGNITVALLTASAILLGGALQLRLDIAIWPALVAFLSNVGREITKGIDDYDGDAKTGVKTLAVRFGTKKAANVAVGFLVATFVIAFIPYILSFFSIVYFIFLLGIDVLLVAVIIRLLQELSPRSAHSLKTWLKIIMLLGLLAFLLGAIPL